jgi:prepilin-type N-terminal cleavage/methylation domain-containing protein
MNIPLSNHEPAETLSRERRGFTLIELLIVIAIIGLLAGMIFPITKALNRTKLRTRARGELALLETAIESYKAKVGVFPPDNLVPAGNTSHVNPRINQLYFELFGTTASVAADGKITEFRTLDGSAGLNPTQVNALFHTASFVNTTKGSGDEGAVAQNFLRHLNPNQYVELKPTPVNAARFIVSSVPGPTDSGDNMLGLKNFNPWQYNSSKPQYNPNTYDLWVDVLIDGKTNRISNWSREPILVSTPYPAP